MFESSGPATANDIQTFDRRHSAHQYGVRKIFYVRDHIELVVHAVDEINVSRAANAVHRFRAARASAVVSVRGLVLWASISFGLHDDSGHPRAVSVRNDQLISQQIARDFEHIGASIEFAGQLHGINPPITQITQKE